MSYKEKGVLDAIQIRPKREQSTILDGQTVNLRIKIEFAYANRCN